MERVIEEVYEQAKLRRGDSAWIKRLQGAYWALCFRLTLLLEWIISSHQVKGSRILNFGCGLNFLPDATNSDLWAPHRYLKARQQPDLYWTGQTPLTQYMEYFDVIICEHVIEHLLPDSTSQLFRHLANCLRPGGVLLISYPDIAKVMFGSPCQRYNTPIVSVNAIIYRYGHLFMYNPDVVTSILAGCDINDVEVSPRIPEKYKSYFVSEREPESMYLIAKKQHS